MLVQVLKQRQEMLIKLKSKEIISEEAQERMKKIEKKYLKNTKKMSEN